MVDRSHYWQNIVSLQTRNYTCGYGGCGRHVGADKGWPHPGGDGYIYICPYCKRPTFFDTDDTQFPGVALGEAVKNLPPQIQTIWEEIRTCTSHDAFTSAVLAGRKLLMHIAVEQGATPGLAFIEYVDHLVTHHFAPPNSKLGLIKLGRMVMKRPMRLF